jgi:RNA polymerase sigma-70 factor (ECF subfamily)
LFNFFHLWASKTPEMDTITLKRAPKREAASEEDRLLVEQAQAGDREAFEQLVHRHDRDILRLAFHMLGNREEAREVFQDTFLKAYRSLGRFRSDSSFYTWIYRIATNVALDRLRKRQSLREEISYEADTEAHPDRPALKDTLEEKSYYSNPERRLYGREIGERIQEAVGTLSEKERLVFELRHYQGLRLRMIGEIMGSTEETAKNYLFRATQNLRTYLTQV